MNAPCTTRDDHYAGLGKLLASAGVSAERTERLVLAEMDEHARETRLTISRDICTLVDGYLSALDRGYLTRLDDAQNLITKIHIQLEVSRRHLGDQRSARNRTIIALLLLQVLGTCAILLAMLRNGSLVR